MTPEVQAPIDKTARHRAAETARTSREAIAKADAQQQPATTSEGVDWTLQTR